MSITDEEIQGALAKLIAEARDGTKNPRILTKGGELNISKLCREFAFPRVSVHKKFQNLLDQLTAHCERNAASGGSEDGRAPPSQVAILQELCRAYLLEIQALRSKLERSDAECARLKRLMKTGPVGISKAEPPPE